jgi:ATP synthase
LAREGEVLLGTRQLDMRRGLLLSAWTHRTPAGITATGRELRLRSLADRAAAISATRAGSQRHRREAGLSFAAENGARMRAMIAARSNVARKLDELVGSFRRLRQEEITGEIIELSAGIISAAASSGRKRA